MTKFQKIVLGIVAGICVMLLFSVAILSKDVQNAGGVYQTIQPDFSEGISVDGTEVITGAGSWKGAISTTLSTLIGSVTNGLYFYRPVITPTADTTLTIAQTDAIVNMGTAGVDITLPAPTAATGVHYRFVVSAAFATTNMTIVAGTADTLEGSLIVAGAVVACDAADLITISATSEDIGDFIDVFSNGTNWIVGANQAMTASQHVCSG